MKQANLARSNARQYVTRAVTGIVFALGFTYTAQATCQRVTMTYSENWDGISYLDEAEKPTGYAIEIHQNIFRKLGKELDLVPNIPWKRQLHLLSTGKVHAIAALNYNESRNAKYMLTDELRATPVRVFSRRDYPVHFSRLADLEKYQGGTSRGARYGTEFDTFAARSTSFIRINGTTNIVQLLQSKRIDYFVLPQDLGNRLVVKAGASDDITTVGAPVHSISIRAAFSRQTECAALVPAFNAALSTLKSAGQLDALDKKYFVN